ncbi:hypothetical protein [Rubellicoccus peritrichatus]|uniref:Uncharacterized protein n=1 Tax=Rubellicoccus peritrichatus TaxID=3080537 RepID=A0AAQ3QSK3_9BACT|nr:hypothetical protein [Puniceicoccus sp. CR14]WOO42578.1 hypothetical protein RZN69_05705 [Puniceicoccus sp. CR14]
MRVIIISFVVLCLCSFLLIAFFPDSAEPLETVEIQVEARPKEQPLQSSSSEPTGLASDLLGDDFQFGLDAFIPPKTVAEQIDFILTDATVSSDKYLLLVELLGTNEGEVLAYLSERRYPEQMAVESAEYDEVAMITRALLEFYMEKPLADNLQKVEQLRPTGPLFSNIVGDLFFAGAGAESAGIAYDWVMANPEHPASLRSGATIGTMLSDFTPEEAWSKAVDLPEGPIRTRAFTAIVVESTNGDIDAAIDYINSIEETPDLDEAISGVLSQGMNSGYPYSELVDIAVAPVDPMYRSSSLVMLFNNWAADDPASLVEWSNQQHQFPPDQMAEINLVVKQTLERHQVEF